MKPIYWKWLSVLMLVPMFLLLYWLSNGMWSTKAFFVALGCVFVGGVSFALWDKAELKE